VRNAYSPYKRLVFFLVIGFLLAPFQLWASGAYPYRLPDPKLFLDPQADTVIGLSQEYTIKEKDTFLDVARNFDLGFNELEAIYPEIDPWIPPIGMKVLIPSQWILPPAKKFGLVINVPEMRLYFYIKSHRLVRTYPVGIGDQGWFTPEGTGSIINKRKNPAWHIPKSLQEKYQMKIMPPGPDNPLGDYWLGLSFPGYGIHGTNFPWAVGRLVTHGCIRLYPEDVETLFSMVSPKTPVEIIYQPVKVGFKRGRIYLEVHDDIYQKIPDFMKYGLKKIETMGLAEKVNLELVLKILDEKTGMPVDITGDQFSP